MTIALPCPRPRTPILLPWPALVLAAALIVAAPLCGAVAILAGVAIPPGGLPSIWIPAQALAGEVPLHALGVAAEAGILAGGIAWMTTLRRRDLLGAATFTMLLAATVMPPALSAAYPAIAASLAAALVRRDRHGWLVFALAVAMLVPGLSALAGVAAMLTSGRPLFRRAANDNPVYPRAVRPAFRLALPVHPATLAVFSGENR